MDVFDLLLKSKSHWMSSLPRVVCHPAQCDRDQDRPYLIERKLEGRLPSFVVTKPNLLTKQKRFSLPLAPVSRIWSRKNHKSVYRGGHDVRAD